MSTSLLKKRTKGPLYVPTLDRGQVNDLASVVLQAKSLKKAGKLLKGYAANLPNRGAQSWKWYINRYAKRFSQEKVGGKIFSLKGNTKLPFCSFSALPGFSCPGAGECLAWCYSFRAWRYPGAFLRQLQNTLLLRNEPQQIEEAFNLLEKGLTFRLYVDGDFASVDEVAFWMRLLRSRPDIKAYGYSKSFDELWTYDQSNEWPDNYVLNLSDGGATRSITKEQMATLPITRGQFVALPIRYHPEGMKGNVGFKMFDDPEYHRLVREAAAEAGMPKVFSCPGRCGSCTTQEHACGSRDRFAGVVIAIGIH